jgi:hypothetical protein
LQAGTRHIRTVDMLKIFYYFIILVFSAQVYKEFLLANAGENKYGNLSEK